MSAVRRASARDVSHTGEVPAHRGGPCTWSQADAFQWVQDSLSRTRFQAVWSWGSVGGWMEAASVEGQRQEHTDLGRNLPGSDTRRPHGRLQTLHGARGCLAPLRTDPRGGGKTFPSSCSSFLCPMPPHPEGRPAGSGGPSCPSARVHGYPSRRAGEPSPTTASLCPGLCGQDRRAQGGAQGGAVLCLGEHSSEGLFPRRLAKVCDGRGR